MRYCGERSTKRIVILNELPGDVKDLTEETTKTMNHIDVDLSGAFYTERSICERFLGLYAYAPQWPQAAQASDIGMIPLLDRVSILAV